MSGLDPAGPFFSYTDPAVRLDPGDAKNVDVIHTDAGLLGTSQNVGHIDFFPNGGSRQPGCFFRFISNPFTSTTVTEQLFPTKLHQESF